MSGRSNEARIYSEDPLMAGVRFLETGEVPHAPGKVTFGESRLGEVIPLFYDPDFGKKAIEAYNARAVSMSSAQELRAPRLRQVVSQASAALENARPKLKDLGKRTELAGIGILTTIVRLI